MKRICSVTLLVILLAALLSVSALADSSNSYAIDSAHFDAVLNTDGSADITETWTIRFISGSFTRFYHDISYSGVGKDEAFTISDVRVWIDGTECTQTDDTEGRPDWCYYISSDRPGAEIDAYLRSSGVTRTYVFQYTLNDVIKLVGDTYDLFTYRFTGENFTQKIGDLSVTLTVPNGTPEAEYSSGGTLAADGTTVTGQRSNSSGLYKLRVRIDDADIPGAVNISRSDVSSTKTTTFNSEVFFLILLVVGIPVLLVIGANRMGRGNGGGGDGGSFGCGGGGCGGGGCGGGGCGGGGAD